MSPPRILHPESVERDRDFRPVHARRGAKQAKPCQVQPLALVEAALRIDEGCQCDQIRGKRVGAGRTPQPERDAFASDDLSRGVGADRKVDPAVVVVHRGERVVIRARSHPQQFERLRIAAPGIAAPARRPVSQSPVVELGSGAGRIVGAIRHGPAHPSGRTASL